MFQGKAKTVSEYLDALPEDRRQVVARLRAFVKKHLPKGYEEQIGWGAITYAVPLRILPDTYNGQPLCYAAIAAQKNHYSLYLMSPYGDAAQARWMADEFQKRGKTLDMGKACLRFTSLDDLPLDVVGQVLASRPMADYVEIYRASRAKGKNASRLAAGIRSKKPKTRAST
ncbi:MAG: DUF1801 domain-containing protein [Vicinamibacterales bacterium]